MAERAIKSRKLAIENPNSIEVDEEFLPWIFDEDNDYWISFDGNYSFTSPNQKRIKELERKKEYEDKLQNSKEISLERHIQQMTWSKMREHVLERDEYTCQICGATKPTKLHIHHILKRRENGPDTYDNLITVCPKCHKSLDGKLYNPNWKELCGVEEEDEDNNEEDAEEELVYDIHGYSVECKKCGELLTRDSDGDIECQQCEMTWGSELETIT